MTSDAVITPSWDELCPQLADGVSVDPPLTPGAPWVIAASGVPRARVGADFARLTGMLDGRRTVHEAVDQAGVTADSTQAIAAVEALAGAGLVRPVDEHDTRAKTRLPRRVSFRPPLTVQWVLFDPASFARRIARPFPRRAFRVSSAVLVTTLLILAVVSVVVHGDLILRSLSTPVSVGLLLCLAGAIVLSGCLHELSHAVALAALGGRPTRMGIMLFYFMPAFFCDVTDGWRLGGRWRRVAVALAGPGLHLLLAAAAFTALLIPVPADVREFLALCGIACMIAVVTNLIPFIKLDGYLALMAITDRPYLRVTAMAAASRSLARRLFGVDLQPGAPRESARMVLFGMACTLFPMAMFLWAAIRLQPSFVGMGPWMSAIYVLLVLAFVAAVTRRLLQFVAACLRRGARVGRMALASVATVALAALLLLVPVSSTVHIGFTVSDGRVLLVASAPSALESLRPGEPVRLLSNGILLRPDAGTGEISGHQPKPVPVDVPVSALAPVTMPDAVAPAWGVPLADTTSRGTLPVAGAAEVVVDRSLPLGSFLFELLIREPAQAIFASGAPDDAQHDGR